MNYKYKKGQLFRKKLNVPKNILDKVYSRTLHFEDFIAYALDDKIPVSCLMQSDRQIVEKFGLEKAKTLDWELLDKRVYYNDINFKELIMNMDSSVEDINTQLYELVKDQIRPKDYSTKMKTIYSNRLFEISSDGNKEFYYEKARFNEGDISLKEIVHNWNLYKDKDLSYCLLNDESNVNKIDDNYIKQFMNSYGTIARLVSNDIDIYDFINEIATIKTEEERKEYIKHFTDNILSNTRREYGDYRPPIKLSDEEYKEIFKYSSLEKHLQLYNYGYAQTIIEELKTLPQDYIFNIPIPFSKLLNSKVLDFIGVYGLKNVVDFDNECGHIFTKDDCGILKSMSDMYLHYGINNQDPNTTIFTKSNYDSNGNYIERPYTKDEFYEAMRRMIVYGPTNANYNGKILDYRDMPSEFKIRNANLFISEQAPEELQKMFYTGTLTPQLLAEHEEFIPYLKDKNLGSCFKKEIIKVYENNEIYNYENLYNFISSKADFNTVMSFITKYKDMLSLYFESEMLNKYQNKMRITMEDDIEEIKEKIINAFFKKSLIEKRAIYPDDIHEKFKLNNPTLFLSDDAPKELQEAFYNRTIDTEFILSNPSYKNYLKGIDLEVIYKYMPIDTIKENNKIEQINLISAIKQTFGEKDSLDFMLLYDKYIEKVFEKNGFQTFTYDYNFSKEDLINELDSKILQAIISGKIKYDETIPKHFKDSNPTLFLDENVPQEIKDKFYNREFTINDFEKNPELFEIFKKTNIAYAFSEEMSWSISLFKDEENIQNANYKRMKIIMEYSKIQDEMLKEIFKSFVAESIDNINIEKIEDVTKILSRLELSNSSEISTFRKELAVQILKSANPLEDLNKIENIFIKNNIPTIGKIYACFDILHPDFQGFYFENSKISPILKNSSTSSKKIIVFSDLIKTFFGSNNKSVNTYIKNIEFGSNLYENIKNGHIQYNALNEEEQKELITFSKHLATLYNNTMKGKKDNETYVSTGNVLTDIQELSKKLSPNGTLNYNIGDRVIKMFCGFTGIDTLDQAKNYIIDKIKTADTRNRNAAVSEMKLEQGDFIKGIGDIKYLRNILQNGSVSKEYLGSDAGSDSTPLDTDVSMITSKEGTISEKMSSTAASNYGPIWFVLKNDDRFITTRDNKEELNIKRDISKMEVFYTGVLGKDHYGIRTGFASSEINYIVVDDYDPRVGLEIAMNGFYIPVANKEGKIIFTPNDYDMLRNKMSGLSHFDENNYTLSENLVTNETQYIASQIEQSNHDVKVKRTKITEVIKKSLDELGLDLKTTIDGDLTEGFVELIDTGSTGRGTNKIGDGDFDFMMRLDKKVLSNPSKLNELKQTILKNLGESNTSTLTNSGDFRLKEVQIDDKTNVDIDITFTNKTDKITYSTDMALQDKLATIKKSNPEKYKYVIANIILAKQILKQAEAYKPNRGEVPQGGLGGVGVENWILQNGGSFIDAAKSFVEASNGKSFEEFQSTYQIWDFGDNHLAEKRGQYCHDNFVSNNMSEIGYMKMTQALKEYLKTAQIIKNEDDKITLS